MKKSIFLFIFMAFLLGGCSVLEVDDSLQYINDSTDLVVTITDFAEDAQGMIQEAATNPQVMDELETQLDTLVQEIENFNSIDPPAIVEEVHQQLTTKNEALLEEINTFFVNGEVLVEGLEKSQLFDLINEITDLQAQLEGLGISKE